MIVELYNRAKGRVASPPSVQEKELFDIFLSDSERSIDDFNKMDSARVRDEVALSKLVKKIAYYALLVSTIGSDKIVDYDRSLFFLQSIRNKTVDKSLIHAMRVWIVIIKKLDSGEYSGKAHPVIEDFFKGKVSVVSDPIEREYWLGKLTGLWDSRIQEQEESRYPSASSMMHLADKYYAVFDSVRQMTLDTKPNAQPDDRSKRLGRLALGYAETYLETLKKSSNWDEAFFSKLSTVYNYSIACLALNKDDKSLSAQAAHCMKGVCSIVDDPSLASDKMKADFVGKLKLHRAAYAGTAAYPIVSRHYRVLTGFLRIVPDKPSTSQERILNSSICPR